MNNNEFKESGFIDIEGTILGDQVPGQLIKVYPYDLFNADKDISFIKPNTTTIAQITQKTYNGDEIFHNLNQDENGHYFFELLSSTTVSGKLDVASSTSVFGQSLKYEHEFIGITDQYYDHRHERPVFFSIGEPFNKKKYENGTLPMYFAESIIPAQEFTMGSVIEQLENDINQETLTEINFINVTSLEASEVNFRILFTEDEHFANEVLNGDKLPGFSITLDPHTLLHQIKAKGKVKYKGSLITYSDEFSDIDLFDNSGKLMPLKMTPINVNEKLTMFADWWDYDVSMPLHNAKLFDTPKKIRDVITNKEDYELIEDIIAISAGYASNWVTIPVISDDTKKNYGQIDPKIRIGHAGIKVSTIANLNPLQVIDGLYQTHTNKYNGFVTDITRHRPVKQVLAALSAYIYSSYAVGRGMKSYNQIYLPWYLEPTTQVTFGTSGKGVKTDLPNPDVGATGNVTTYILDSDITFQTKSIYFNDSFSNKQSELGQVGLKIPAQINLSNTTIMQTDRKLIIPEIGDTIQPVSRLLKPGDVDTNSANSLAYIFYVPLWWDVIWEVMMRKEESSNTVPTGTVVDFSVPNSPEGKIWTTADVANWFKSKYRTGTFLSANINTVWTTNTNDLELQSFAANEDNWDRVQVIYKGRVIKVIEADNAADIVTYREVLVVLQTALTDIDLDALSFTTGIGLDTKVTDNGKVPFRTGHSEITNAKYTTTTQTTQTNSINKRLTLFDKQEWKEEVHRASSTFAPSKIHLTTDTEFIIDELNEIIITSVWGNEIILHTGNPLNDMTIKLFNKDDETISKQRILFV